MAICRMDIFGSIFVIMQCEDSAVRYGSRYCTLCPITFLFPLFLQFAAIQSRMTSYETELHDFRKHTEVELERCVASMDHRSRDIIENTRLAITNAIGHAASERDRLKATVT